MMRFAVTKLTAALKEAGAKLSTVRGVNQPLVDAINAALTEVQERDNAFRRWFGGYAANQGVVEQNMQHMADFANGHATLTLVVKDTSRIGADSNAYAWGQGARSRIGQYILNLGSGFGIPFAGTTVALAHATVQGLCLQTIAHELSHLVFSANIDTPNPLHETELYLDHALALASTDPVWASYNADNYGYFIEQCS